jgi:mRNA-degrading endonuclease HigB of HigAB toxin-antitoxin module
LSKIYKYNDFINDVKLTFPNNYDEYIFEGFINKTSNFLIKHNCKYNHEWITKPYIFLNSKGCSKCRQEQISKDQTKSHEKFCQEIKDKYNDEYTVIGGYINAITPINIKHNICNTEWNSIPNNLLRGKECPKCEKIKGGKKHRKTTEQFKQQVFDLVKNEYEVIGNHIYSREKILIKHNKCNNEYFVYPYSFLAGERCPKCYGKFTKTQEEFEKEIYHIYKDEYIVQDTYVNTKTPIKFLHTICNKESYLIPEKLLTYKQSCQHCYTKSVGEKLIIKYLNENNILYKKEFKFEDLKGVGNGFLRFDFAIFDSDNKLQFLLEYDGLYHYKPKKNIESLIKQQEHDKRKNEYCVKNHIKLIRIPYWEFKNIKIILDNLFV